MDIQDVISCYDRKIEQLEKENAELKKENSRLKERKSNSLGNMKWTIKTIGELFMRWGVCKKEKSNREKAIELINAWFDGKTIVMKDPAHGVPNWTSIRHSDYWSYLGAFCNNVDKYKII